MNKVLSKKKKKNLPFCGIGDENFDLTRLASFLPLNYIVRVPKITSTN